MWQRYDGLFFLGPKQAAAFKCAALVLWGSVREDLGFETDVVTFDRLTPGQKQAALLRVCRALLDPQAPPPKVTGELAATVDAIFGELETEVHCEIDNAEQLKLENRLTTRARSLVLAAVEETGYWTEGANDEPAEEPPSPTCTDFAEWTYLVQILEMEILDDFDFEHADRFLDLPPRMVRRLKQLMNIDPGYFTSTTEDPKPDRLAEIQAELRTLIGEVQ
jgi:hypothetical protein